MRPRHVPVLLLLLALLAGACSTGSSGTTVSSLAVPAPGETPPSSWATGAATPDVITDEGVVLPPGLVNLDSAWPTDWSRRTIELDELVRGLRGADPRDLIPPIDIPKFERVPSVEWLADNEPGVVFSVGGDARFYPLSVLTRHEVVNDRVGGTPVAVTYCPLCNTAVVFERRVAGEELRLGVSGLLRNSDLVMWDNDTTSLWQQVTGEAIVGAFAGERLPSLPSRITSYGAFANEYPQGLALGPDQGLGPVYGANPYVGYSSRTAPYDLFTGDLDDRLLALERVVGVDEGGAVKGYPFTVLEEVRVVNDTVGGVPVVVLWGDPGTSDALDSASIPAGAAVGTGVAYRSTLDGTVLTFDVSPDGSLFADRETLSVWNLFGRAISGPLEGAQLEVALHRNEFFFAFAAFFPEADLFGASVPSKG